MTEQYGMGKLSVIDKLTPLQLQAYEQENTALLVKAEGYPTYAIYHKELAASYRRQDRQNKIHELFDRSDAQNVIIDIGLKMQGKFVPILQRSDLPVIKKKIDYTLMQQ